MRHTTLFLLIATVAISCTTTPKDKEAICYRKDLQCTQVNLVPAPGETLESRIENLRKDCEEGGGGLTFEMNSVCETSNVIGYCEPFPMSREEIAAAVIKDGRSPDGRFLSEESKSKTIDFYYKKSQSILRGNFKLYLYAPKYTEESARLYCEGHRLYKFVKSN